MAAPRKKTASKKATPRQAENRNIGREEEVVHADTRQSRESDTWDDFDLDDLEAFVGDDSRLPKIPPRPGFDQRWIRTKIGAEDDPVNVTRAKGMGWKRREPDTLPQSFIALRSYVEGIGDSVGISGMVLMERPIKLSERLKQQVRKRTDSQMKSVDESLFNAHSAGSGFGAPARVEDKTEVTRGKPVTVDSD